MISMIVAWERELATLSWSACESFLAYVSRFRQLVGVFERADVEHSDAQSCLTSLLGWKRPSMLL